MRVALLVVLLACKHDQTAHDAMALVCDAEARAGVARLPPAERPAQLAAWLAEHVTNPEIRRLVDTLGNVDPRMRRALLGEAARKHGVATCAFAAPRPVLETVPEVSGSGVVPQTDVGIVITMSATEVAIDGKAIVLIVGGDVEVDKLAAYPMKDPEALVAIDRSLSYRIIYKVLAAATKAGIRRFDLAAMQRGKPVMVPIAIPERSPRGFTVNKPNDPDLPIQLIVTIGRDRMMLWSLSGLEGTLQAPKLSVARSDYAALRQALAEIVARRFAGGTRDSLDRTIIVMLEGELTAQDLLATAATVAEPFPDVLLAAGIE